MQAAAKPICQTLVGSQARQQPSPAPCASAGQNCTGQGCGPALVRHPSCGASCGCLAVPRAQRDHLSTLGDVICCWGAIPMPSSSSQCWGCAFPTSGPSCKAQTEKTCLYSPTSNPQGTDPLVQELEYPHPKMCSCALQSRCTAPGMPHIHPPPSVLSAPLPHGPQGTRGDNPSHPSACTLLLSSYTQSGTATSQGHSSRCSPALQPLCHSR